MSAVAVSGESPRLIGDSVGMNGRRDDGRLPVMIDFLAVSVDLQAVLDGCPDWHKLFVDTVNDLNDVGIFALDVARIAANYLFGGVFAVSDDLRRGRFYRWRVRLQNASGDYVGLIEFGGVETCRTDGTYTLRAELTGQGCRIYESSGMDAGCSHAQRWGQLADRLGLVSTRITRVDLACDDYDGCYSIDWALAQYQAGAFDKRGQRPKPKMIDDMGSGDGRTFYLGSRTSENLLRVYEKGKEQGDRDSSWVRFEAQLKGSSRRLIPLDVLINCDAYLKGAYPALHFVSGVGERISSVSRAVAASAIKAVRNFRRQYGPFANLLLHASEGCEIRVTQMLKECSRSVMPQWFRIGGVACLDDFRAAIPIN